MKKENSNRGIVIGVLALVVLIFLVGITAVGVYAARSVNDRVGSFINQVNPLIAEPTLQDEDSNAETSIYDQGVLVRQVDAGSPAAEAGIRRGSIIQAVDGTAVNTPAELSAALNEKGPGASVQLQVLDSLVPKSKTVTLADAAPLLGVKLVGDTGDGECNCDFEGFMPPGDLGQFRMDPDNMPFDMPFDMHALTAGVLVAEIIPDTAAAESDLQTGDIITAIDGTAVATPDELVTILGSMQPGDSIDLTIEREGVEENVTVTLGTHPEDNSKAFLGISPAATAAGGFHGRFGQNGGQIPFNPDDFDFGAQTGTSGIGIVSVLEDSAAEAAGLQVGDAVISVNETAVETVDAFIEEISSLQPGDSIDITVEREGETVDLTATLGTHPDDESKAFLGVELGAFYNVDVDRFGPSGGFGPNSDFSMPFDLDNLEELQEMFPDFFDQLPMQPSTSEELDA